MVFTLAPVCPRNGSAFREEIMNQKQNLYVSSKDPLLIRPNHPLPKQVATIGAGTIGPDIGY
mgnify:CR=1 FL=1